MQYELDLNLDLDIQSKIESYEITRIFDEWDFDELSTIFHEDHLDHFDEQDDALI